MPYEAAIGIGMIVLMICLICIGIPIYLSMFVATILGFLLIGGPNLLLLQFTRGPFTLSENYMLAVIPLFVLLGQLAAETGLAEKSFKSLNLWVGKLRGGLLMATVGSNAVFGAVSAVPIAVTALSIKVALPELLRYKYNKAFCLAAIATAGVLASLIPPSTAVIVFCVLTDVSIGRALVASIIPGILLTVLYFLNIWIYGKIFPYKIPAVDIEVSWKDRFKSLTSLWPILFIFLLIIGGIYLGVFPPPVGGAVGALAAIIYALILKVEKKKIARSFWDMVVINCQIFPMLIAGFMFARVISFSGLTNYLVIFVSNLDMPPLAIFAIIIILMILISFPMDLLPVLIVTVPIFFPILTSLGFSPYTIIVALLILGVLADLTPPIGMSIWVTASMAKVSAMEVYRGVIPWFIITFIFLWIVILIPSLSNWLPNLMYK